MKYLCLICAEKVMEQMPKPDADKHFEEYREFTEAIRDSGHFVDCNRLLPAQVAVTLRVRDGKVLMTDGPFQETKEQFGGYYIIEADDMDKAIMVAAGIPGAKLGCVEVRPIADDAQTLRALGLSTWEAA
ncbi:MAG: YciI family protein [Nitrosomonadales bacterium]|nr:YciI family protein [Nitrosomonadales bacterium]